MSRSPSGCLPCVQSAPHPLRVADLSCLGSVLRDVPVPRISFTPFSILPAGHWEPLCPCPDLRTGQSSLSGRDTWGLGDAVVTMNPACACEVRCGRRGTLTWWCHGKCSLGRRAVHSPSLSTDISPPHPKLALTSLHHIPIPDQLNRRRRTSAKVPLRPTP